MHHVSLYMNASHKISLTSFVKIATRATFRCAILQTNKQYWLKSKQQLPFGFAQQKSYY